METAAARPSATTPYPLVDLDDLHEADLDRVLAEQLTGAVTSAEDLAALTGRSARAALTAHALPAHLLLLAVF
ncbi:hypothetical protein [Blastococcus tunisiensis]|jgi:hypothetical protein|uniref:Uncharacterized protein n=1 Tax=Blastococcus tunisiensis TaxID=1798228 RepID=A0A1I2IGC0_9ACTN|nr:hypothetical protein [Blastococcus sp. DSM 46838]SFF41365.1 hypothetical protein SAMN05216574_11352 [Blastococcus sp. DSM 46838]